MSSIKGAPHHRVEHVAELKQELTHPPESPALHCWSPNQPSQQYNSVKNEPKLTDIVTKPPVVKSGSVVNKISKVQQAITNLFAIDPSSTPATPQKPLIRN